MKRKKERKKENGCKSTKFQTVRNSRTLSLRCYSGVRSLEWSSYFSHYFFVLHIAQALDPCFPLVNLSGKKRSPPRLSFQFTWWFSIWLWCHRMALSPNKYFMLHSSERMQNHLFLHCPICISIASIWNTPLGAFRNLCD